MKRPLVLALFLTLSLGLTGCMQVAMNTTIDKDGSGTMFMSYSMSQDVADALAELEEMGPMQGMGESPPNFSDFNKDELEKECKKYGATLKSFKEIDSDGRKGMEMEIGFKDLKSLNGVMSESMEGSGGGFGIFKMDDGNYMLKGVEAPESEEDMDEGEEEPETPQQPDPAQMGKMMEVMGKLMASASELEVTMKITVPGDVIEHNAPKIEGRTLIWEVNGENMMTAGQSMEEPEIIFSGKGVDIDAPAYEGQ